jgi:hypothetical protein
MIIPRPFSGDQFFWKWIPPIGRTGGILGGFIITRFNICNTNMGRFHIKITMFYLKIQRKWNLIIVYGDAQEEDKEYFLVELGNV